MFAGHHQLTNLVALVDYNKIQSFRPGRRSASARAVRRQVDQLRLAGNGVDGHDHTALAEALADKGATSRTCSSVAP